MGAAIGGHLIVMPAFTIPGLRPTVVLIGVMATIIRRLTTITIRELMAGNRVLTDRTGPRRRGHATILTREPTREGIGFRLHMVAGAPARRTIRIPGPTPRLDKVLVRTL